jgi:2-polyprenyl-6-methoxyphenol hydroxylase-like FAD-dependent oxidoreductase
MTAKTALIVGAGVAGLSAAWWLSRIGWQVEIVERAVDLRANGYMLGLSGPGHEVAGRMGILPALETRSRLIRENLYLGRDGKVLMRLRYHDFLNGIDWLTLARTSLVEVLHEAVRDRLPIHFGTTIAEVLAGTEDNATAVKVRLTDGSVRDVDLLIGADGIHSQVRSLAFDPAETFMSRLGYGVAAFQIDDCLDLGQDFLSYAEPGRLSEFYTLSEGKLATLYVWRAEQAVAVATGERRSVLKQAFQGAHPDALRLIDELPDAAPLFFDDMAMIEMPNWSRGRVVLLGDSAHCLTLISGQGAGMAMVSACLLSAELGRHEIGAALRRHEERLRPAITRLQARSRKMAPVFIPSTARAFAFRNFILRHAPRRLLNWYFVQGIRSEILAAQQDP